jgi:predicted dehydrogenase
VEPLRIGVLGAARIAGLAIVGPARTTGDRLVAVAARDRRRAEAFAVEHGVERVVGSYAEVVTDPEVEVAIAAPADDDPRWSLELAGGALMDLGCYSLHAHRVLAPWAGGLPRLVAARAGERAGRPGVDEWLDADLVFPNGATGTARCSMAGDRRMTCRIVGDRGEATAANFVEPHLDDRVFVSAAPDGERVEELGRRSSYTYQLEALRAHLRDGAPLPIDADDAVASMQLVDDCYRAAGFSPRPRTAPG